MPPTKKPVWLLGIHMQAEATDLEGPMEADIEEVRRVLEYHQTDDVVALVQAELATGVTRRWRLHKGKRTPEPGSAGLAAFYTDFHAEPAEHRAFVLWGHATGVAIGLELPDDTSPIQRFKPAVQAQAKRAGRPVRNSTYTRVGELLDGTYDPVDILGFDTCHMAAVELVCRLGSKKRARYVAGAQAASSLAGWRYDLLVDHMVRASQVFRRPDPKRPQVRGGAREIVAGLVEQVGLDKDSPEGLTVVQLVDDDNKDVAQAVFDAIEALAQAIWNVIWYDPRKRAWILDAFDATAWSRVRQFVDLADLCRRLASHVPDSQIRAAARQLLALLVARFVVDHRVSMDAPMSGLSICCPWLRATRRELAAGARDAWVKERDYSRREEDQPSQVPPRWVSLVFSRELREIALRRTEARNMRDLEDDLLQCVAHGEQSLLPRGAREKEWPRLDKEWPRLEKEWPRDKEWGRGDEVVPLI